VHEPVLIALMNNPDDLRIARDLRWYRIPVYSVRKWLGSRWPPRWLAFYQTKIFGPEAWSVNYFSEVHEIRERSRLELFPEEFDEERLTRRYYQLIIGQLQKLAKPIVSRRWRRIVFISTTWQKFMSAAEINDLFDESPLEDRLWAEFKRLQICAERQQFLEISRRHYALDFAVYCVDGNLDIETDGDTYHANRAEIPKENVRDNDLQSAGWKCLRFNTFQVSEQMAEYCLPTIVQNIDKLGGIDEGRVVPRQINLDRPGTYQLGLFDDYKPDITE
jgi:very-short-patch-repair endonuclease